jgi:hypothetical protein
MISFRTAQTRQSGGEDRKATPAESVGFRSTFSDFKRSTKIVLILSFLLGLISLIAFSLTDAGVNVTLGSLTQSQVG